MSLQALSHFLRRRAAHWERRRTERFIRSLPTEIQKDIGWPDGGRRRATLPQPKSFWERRW